MASRNIILHNFWWKLLSLVLAALTWLLINIESQKDERKMLAESEVETDNRRFFYGIPITVLSSPSSVGRFTINPDVVSVEVSSKDNRALSDLQSAHVQAFVDVTGAEDEKEFRRPIQIQVPQDFEVTAIAPTNASVERITASK